MVQGFQAVPAHPCWTARQTALEARSVQSDLRASCIILLHPIGKCVTLPSMPSKILHVRLNDQEWAHLAHVCGGDQKRNPSEMVRLLLEREFSRRTTGKSVVPENAIASDFRDGRPARLKP